MELEKENLNLHIIENKLIRKEKYIFFKLLFWFLFKKDNLNELEINSFKDDNQNNIVKEDKCEIKILKDEQELEKNEQLNKFNIWYQTKDYYYCADLIKNGLVVSDEIKTTINDFFKSELKDRKSSILDIEKVYKKIPNELFKVWVNSNSYTLKSKKYEEIMNIYFTEEIKKEIFLENLNQIVKNFNLIKEKMSNPYDNNIKVKANVTEIVQHLRQSYDFLILNVNESNFKEIMDFKLMLVNIDENITSKLEQFKSNTKNNREKLGLNIINEILSEEINTLINNYCSKEKENLLKEVKNLNLEESVELEISNIKINVNKEMPIKATQLIKDINEKYKLIIKDSTKDNLEIDKIYKIRLPEVVKKYLLIDESYRESLKNVEGKSAKELMMESLIHIDEILLKKITEINEEKIISLSISQRHLKAVKNNI